MSTLSAVRNQTQEWNCSQCSYLNLPSFYPKCKICLTDNNEVKSKPLTPTAVCPICTKQPVENGQLACSHCENEHILINLTTTSNSNQNPTAFNRSLSSKYTSLAVREREKNDEIDAETRYKQIVQQCRQGKFHFVDDSFAPIPCSIGSERLNQRVSQWLRIRQIRAISNEDSRLQWSVMNDPKPSDIHQGQIGDCWLMAALPLITERPQMLNHILLTKEINEEGIYLVRICKDGLWQTILLDDCFPCTEYGTLAFTQAKRRQLYVPLIEKACAKLFGSYSELTGGSTAEGLQLLTGAPCNEIHLNRTDDKHAGDNDHTDVDLIWVKLFSSCEAGLLIGASTGRSDISEDEYQSAKIHSNHAFSVLRTHQLSAEERFLLIRDPHAHTTYTDSHITKDTLMLLQHVQKTNSGSFWVSWRMFLKYFLTITISQYRPDNFDVRHVGQFTTAANQPVQVYYFYLNQTTLLNISLIHHQSTYMRHTHTQLFLLCDINQQTGEIGGQIAVIRSRHGEFVCWDDSLRQGFYLLIPFSTSFWQVDNDQNKQSQSLNYTLVIHSSNQLELTVVEEPVTVLSHALIQVMLKNSNCAARVSVNDEAF